MSQLIYLLSFASLILFMLCAFAAPGWTCHAEEFSQEEQESIATLAKRIQEVEKEKVVSDQLIDAKLALARVVMPLEHDRALQLYMDAIDVAGQMDKDNPRISKIVSDMALITRFNGFYLAVAPANLIELEKRALAIDEKHFGPEHPETARSIYGLAIAYVLLDFQMYPDDVPKALTETRAKAQFERYIDVFGKRAKDVNTTEYHDALYMLGLIYAVSGNLNSLDTLFLEKTNVGNKTYFFEVSRIAGDCKNKDTTSQLYTKLVGKAEPADKSAFPDDLRALFCATNFFLHTGNAAAGLASAEKAVSVAKASVYAQAWLGQCYADYYKALKANGQSDKSDALTR